MSVAFVREESAQAAQEVTLPAACDFPASQSRDPIRAPCAEAGPR